MRLGIDIGGTFTDLLLVDDDTGNVRIVKVPTTSDDPARGVMMAVSRAVEGLPNSLAVVGILVHGTTLATNTVIERKGCCTALFATRGHRDAVEMRREHRYDMYDVLVDMPEPLAPRHLRFDVDERISAEGELIHPLDREQVERLVRRLAERGVEALAVCFLHSWRNPAHELAVKEIANHLVPDVRVSLSSEVAPEIGEFERTSTTLCNAYVHRRVDRYLKELEDSLSERGFAGSFFVMQSSGGLCGLQTAREFPVRILESGPAGGVMAASYFARTSGLPKLLSFDMGGTTAKIAALDEGQPVVAAGFEVDRAYRFIRGSGLPIKVPSVEMMEIGAGGGSIARIDPMGLIRVGPESAGADPGPACYGRGGEMPTVTDADLLLGYIDPNYFLGGQLPLDVDRARRAVARYIADPLGLGITGAAWAVHRIVNENMASAARMHFAELGKDPGAYTMFAFGGAGPVHAFGVAATLGTTRIVVPFGAGVMSSLGFLTAPLSFEYVRGYYGQLSELDWVEVNRYLEDMEEEGRRTVGTAGLCGDQVGARRWCDMRYCGQGFEVRVALPAGELGEACLDEVQRRFEARYLALYGRTVPGVGLEVVNWRVVVEGPRPSVRISPDTPTETAVEKALKGTRPAYLSEDGSFIEVPVFDRRKLPARAVLHGPAIIEERESTLVFGPRASAKVDPMLSVVVSLQAREKRELGGLGLRSCDDC